MLFDTTFLIDLQLEAIRNEPGRAFQFLETHPETPVRISAITVGEFAEGFPEEKRDLCRELLQPYEVVDVPFDVAWQYARVSRELRETLSSVNRLKSRSADLKRLWEISTVVLIWLPIF
jgi:predicted nucleic acid-binding protein